MIYLLYGRYIYLMSVGWMYIFDQSMDICSKAFVGLRRCFVGLDKSGIVPFCSRVIINLTI